MTGKLSIVATPIGNLQDMTLRGLDTLRSCDMIVCEDTRVTSKLLSVFQISKPLRSLHEHTSSSGVDKIIQDISRGKHIAYVSDAGTPGVNDPGGKLVEAAYMSHLVVEPIPGASSVTTAISICGFPMDEFAYLGFAPHKKGRQTFFTEIEQRKIPSIFFESTHRIAKTLDALHEILNAQRKICIARELTKMHETIYRGTVAEVQSAIEQTSTKGEFVIIIGPSLKKLK
jgi:16S rRNA (cytidine1402-2'-O)-methyltransferase